jgi:hypothetical protein
MDTLTTDLLLISFCNKINLIQIKTLSLPELEKMIYDQFFHLLLATAISTQVKANDYVAVVKDQY